MKLQIQTGAVAGITFLDHVEGGREPETFIVYGIIQEVHPQYIVIASWAYPDGITRHDENETIFTLIRSTIQNIKIYSE